MTPKTEVIEQLRAHIAELEAEKKELQALLDFDNARLDQIEDELEDVEYLGPYVEGIKVLKKQLAAVQEEMNDWRNQAHQSQSAFDRLQDQLAELKEENARLKAESRDASLGLNDYYGRKLAAEQLNNKRLREALNDTFSFLERHSNRWDGINGKHPQAVAEAAREALSLPASTEALDEYVAEKVKEAKL